MGFFSGKDDRTVDTESRVPSTGALVASAAGCAVLVIADMHLPYLAGWALNTTAILGVSWGIARYKQNRAAWGCFAALAGICAMEPFLALAGLMDGARSAVYWIVCAAVVSVWYWLLRFGPVRPAPGPEVQHVVHHHVVHGAQEAAPVRPVRPVTVPGRVLRPAIASVGGRRHLSGMLPEAVLQCLGTPGEER